MGWQLEPYSINVYYTLRKRFIGALILWKHLGEINNSPKTLIEFMNAFGSFFPQSGLRLFMVPFINFINQFIKRNLVFLLKGWTWELNPGLRHEKTVLYHWATDAPLCQWILFNKIILLFQRSQNFQTIHNLYEWHHSSHSQKCNP